MLGHGSLEFLLYVSRVENMFIHKYEMFNTMLPVFFIRLV